MSYCRFSCDDFQCDIYCYHSIGDFYQIYVAVNRPVYKEPLPAPVPFDSENLPAWMERNDKVMKMVEVADRVDIGLSHDGESFECDTAEEAVDTLVMLRNAGYKFPDSVIEALMEEFGDSD